MSVIRMERAMKQRILLWMPMNAKIGTRNTYNPRKPVDHTNLVPQSKLCVVIHVSIKGMAAEGGFYR